MPIATHLSSRPIVAGTLTLVASIMLGGLGGLGGCRTPSKASQDAQLLDTAPTAENVAAFKRYCVSCHDTFADDDGNVKWDVIQANGAQIARRLDWETAPAADQMPPVGTPKRNQLAANPTVRAAMRASLAGSTQPATEPTLAQLVLRPGFRIRTWAEVPGARSMTISPTGTVFVGTGGLGSSVNSVYAVRDADGDGRAEMVKIIADGLNTPNGVAFKDGTLYVAERNRILKMPNIEAQLDNPPAPVSIGVTFPNEAHHGWKFLAFGPDGKLYTHVGAPCNVCQVDGDFGRMFRVNIDGSGKQEIASGIRNSVGFAWHPVTREMWFTENGRDSLGNEIPADELNRLVGNNPSFGFPFCHQGDTPDPDFANLGTCNQAVPPALKLPPHAAALGLRFYTGSMFPPEYRNALFIAERGSWNRTPPQPPRVQVVTLNPAGTQVVSNDDFIGGWQNASGDRVGRPVDVEWLADGSMLVSDATAGKIYRVTYQP